MTVPPKSYLIIQIVGKVLCHHRESHKAWIKILKEQAEKPFMKSLQGDIKNKLRSVFIIKALLSRAA